MTISNYVSKTMIAWHYYNENYAGEFSSGPNKRSYVYPRIIKKADDEYVAIVDHENEFPKKGRIEVKITGDLTAEELYEQVGDIVEVRMNREPDYNPNSNNSYSLRLNRDIDKSRSDIWVEKFSGKGFTQVIKASEDWEKVQREHKMYCVDKIYTNEILLLQNGKYYGPFEYDKKDENISLVGKKDNKYYIAEYEQDELKEATFIVDNPESNASVTFVFKNAIKSPMDCPEKIDWIDDDKLIEYMNNILKKQSNITKDEARRFREDITRLVEEDEEMNLDDIRVDRINELLNKSEERGSLIQMIVRNTLEDEELNREVARLICENHFDYIEKNSQELIQYQERLSELEQKEVNLSARIEQKENNLTLLMEQAQQGQNEKFEEIKQKIEELESKKNQLNNEIELSLKTLQDINEIKELENKKVEIERKTEHAVMMKEIREGDLRKTEDKIRDLEAELNRILDNYNNETNLVVNKLDKEFLNKVFREISGENTGELELFNQKLFYEEALNGEEIISIVHKYLSDEANRNVSYNDVVNYLTCIGQGFITTFAGLPGTGKTSVCSLIAKALGLAGDGNNRRYIEIAVERGWTSHKDFIGYYNPLTKQLEKSNTEVFEAFERMNRETGEKVAPMFLLLDEANLSPIEHYWSAFIKNCDFDSATKKTISLGGNVNWNVTDNLRFLATVNFDHTTEELSPRFLDRSWIIVLEPGQIDEDGFVTGEILNARKVVAFEDFIKAFGRDEEINIEDIILTKWKKIRNIFKENDLMIMPRNVKMVYEYCNIASKYMKRDTPETRFAPLDFAVAQKILPTINGAGDNYDKLILQLQEECSENTMPLCYKILRRMKKKSDMNMGYYQFFSM